MENVKSFTRTNINKTDFTPRKARKSRHFWHFKPTKQNLWGFLWWINVDKLSIYGSLSIDLKLFAHILPKMACFWRCVVPTIWIINFPRIIRRTIWFFCSSTPAEFDWSRCNLHIGQKIELAGHTLDLPIYDMVSQCLRICHCLRICQCLRICHCLLIGDVAICLLGTKSACSTHP